MLALGILVACSCASPPPVILHEASTPARPKWIDQPPSGGDILYFVGIRTGASSLEEARSSAMKDAFGQVAGYIRSDVTSDFQDLSTEIWSKMSSKITSESFASIKGAEVADSYYDKTSRIEKRVTLESIDYFVLVKFSRSEAIRELARQKQEREKNVKLACQMYVKGKSAEDKGNLKEARSLYVQSRDILSGIKETVDLGDAGFATSTELRAAVESRIPEVVRKMHTVSVSYSVEGGTSSDVFITSLASTLANRGFPIGKPASIAVTASVQLRAGGTVMENSVYFAECNAVAQNTKTKEVLASVFCKEKSINKRPEQAAKDALLRAGASVADSLAMKIIQLEEKS